MKPIFAKNINLVLFIIMKTIFYKEKSIVISADKNDLSDCFIIQSKKKIFQP